MNESEKLLIELLKAVYELGKIHAKQEQASLNKEALIKIIERSRLTVD